jgi:photosystem II stability/assembly factor-like uncharacterized protein
MNTYITAFLLFIQTLFNCDSNQNKTCTPITNMILQSTDGGQTWVDVSSGLPGDLQINCVYADDDHIILGHDHGLYRSSSTRIPNWIPDLLLDERITNIFPGKTSLYARSPMRGFMKEIKGTGIWKPVFSQLNGDVVRTFLETEDGNLFVGCNKGIYKSSDNGNTWKLVFTDGFVSELVAAEGIIIAGSNLGILRSTDSGEHWEKVLVEDRPTRKTTYFEGRFYAISTGIGSYQDAINDPGRATNRLRTSKDGGKTWECIDENLSTIRFMYSINQNAAPVRMINDIEKLGKYLICSLDNGIYRSADYGKTWTLVLQPVNRKNFKLAVSGKTIYAVPIFEGC